MHLKFTTSFLAIGSLVGLAACGGSTTGGAAPSYETLASTATSGTATLGGSAYRHNDTAYTTGVTNFIGSVDFGTGQIIIDDGTYRLVDPDGVSNVANLGMLTDGTEEMSQIAGSGTYDYVTYVKFPYSKDGSDYRSFGQIGIVTNNVDMPSSGTASYSGEAWGYYIYGTDEVFLQDGTSTVLADFDSATVTATLDGFRAEDANGLSAVSVIDTVVLGEMEIHGNEFYSGWLDVTKSGNSVDLFGANARGATEGDFYGYDATINAPDEIGGSAVRVGDDGYLQVDFIAD